MGHVRWPDFALRFDGKAMGHGCFSSMARSATVACGERSSNRSRIRSQS